MTKHLNITQECLCEKLEDVYFLDYTSSKNTSEQDKTQSKATYAFRRKKYLLYEERINRIA